MTSVLWQDHVLNHSNDLLFNDGLMPVTDDICSATDLRRYASDGLRTLCETKTRAGA